GDDFDDVSGPAGQGSGRFRPGLGGIATTHALCPPGGDAIYPPRSPAAGDYRSLWSSVSVERSGGRQIAGDLAHDTSVADQPTGGRGELNGGATQRFGRLMGSIGQGPGVARIDGSGCLRPAPYARIVLHGAGECQRARG